MSTATRRSLTSRLRFRHLMANAYRTGGSATYVSALYEIAWIYPIRQGGGRVAVLRRVRCDKKSKDTSRLETGKVKTRNKTWDGEGITRWSKVSVASWCAMKFNGSGEKKSKCGKS